ncbi:hypothetical protein D3C77_684040 [compost metagenome]
MMAAPWLPICKPSSMVFSLPNWPLGNSTKLTRPSVFSLTSAAKPSAALFQLWLGASTWPSLMSRAWADSGAKPAMATSAPPIRARNVWGAWVMG